MNWIIFFNVVGLGFAALFYMIAAVLVSNRFADKFGTGVSTAVFSAFVIIALAAVIGIIS